MTMKIPFSLCLSLTCIAAADVRLPGLFSDHMVLQRDKPLAVWGSADAGEKVSVGLAEQTVTTTADASGSWSVKLEALPAGGPHEMTVTANNKLTFRDVLVGDVWLCSGQSNMQWPLKNATNGDAEVAAAIHPRLRLMTIKPTTSLTQMLDPPTAGWLECNPENAGPFSAVGYFFGQHLLKSQDVPVGLINASWGGTVCEAWTSVATLKTLPDFVSRAELVEQVAATGKPFDADKAMDDWFRDNDLGSVDGMPWAQPGFDTTGWKEMLLPSNWEKAGLPDFDGIVWFRKEIEIPAAWAGKDLVISLGGIDDNDATFVNGVKVGGHRSVGTERVYQIQAALLKPGRNTLAIRVLDTALNGGITGPAEKMKLAPVNADSAEPLPLDGPWLYQPAKPLAKLPPFPEQIGQSPNVSSVLFNGMIVPLVRYPLRGAIWYQGESNVARAHQYRSLFPAMIRDWRKAWGDDFPFGFVQLANFMPSTTAPGESAWAELREAQTMTLTQPHTGMAVAIDVGEAENIHPTNKQEVGKRLALWAEAKVFGKNQVFSGPLYQSMKIEGNQLRLTFDHVGSGLAIGGGALEAFAIAGKDRKFVRADARIEGATVLVSSPLVPEPVSVRYAWADNPEGCNLRNAEGLPASPFRTDQWPGLSVGAK